MAAYIKNEEIYREIIRGFLSKKTNSNTFVNEFMEQWKHDRDKQWEDIEKGEEPNEAENELNNKLLDQIFSACDCYDPNPENEYEINDEQLFNEVKILATNYWGDF